MDDTASPPIETLIELLREADGDELMLNGTHSAWLQSEFGLKEIPNPFQSRTEMIRSLQDFAIAQGLRLDPFQPANGGMIDAEYRWHCLLPPLAVNGPIFSLRRHRFRKISLGSFFTDQQHRREIESAMEKRRSMLICGATGSGKTSFLVALLARFAGMERAFILESINEIPLLSERWVKLLARDKNVDGNGEISLNRLLRESLRLRPERLVIGEVRGEECYSLIQAVLSGHAGVLATLHAGSAAEARARLIGLFSYEIGGTRAAGFHSIDSMLRAAELLVVKLEDRVVTTISSL